MRDWLYLLDQWRHTRAKRWKDPSFRIVPSIDVIQRYVRCPVGNVLDLGPRNLHEVHALASAGLGRIDAVDLFPTHARIRKGDMHALPSRDNAYDLAFLSHVLEHAHDVRLAAKEIARVVRPGGYVWIAVPTGFTPNRHDRVCFTHRREILALFDDATPETLFDGSNDRELRLLIRLWKEPYRPPVVIALTTSLHVRNWVASGLVRMVVEAGHRVMLLVPRRQIVAVREVLGLDTVDVREVEPYLGSATMRRLRAGMLRTASFVSREGESTTYPHKLGLRHGLWARAEIATLHGLRWLVDPERAACWVEDHVAPSAVTMALMHQVRPGLVVVPTTIQDAGEVEFLKSARAQGVPSLVHIANWDALTAKGALLVRPTMLAVWGLVQRDHAEQRHGFARSQVRITGPAHWDHYAVARAHLPRGLVLVAGSTVAYFRDELQLVRDLRAALPSTVTIWYRPHPRKPLSEVEEMLGQDGIFIDSLWLHQARNGGGFPLGVGNPDYDRALLDSVNVLVTTFSTMLLEAALRDVPSCVVGFGGSSIDRSGLLQMGQYEHMTEVLRLPGIQFAPTFEVLMQQVTAILRDGSRGDLQPAVSAIADCRDGLARNRIVEVIGEMAGR